MKNKEVIIPCTDCAREILFAIVSGNTKFVEPVYTDYFYEMATKDANHILNYVKRQENEIKQLKKELVKIRKIVGKK